MEYILDSAILLTWKVMKVRDSSFARATSKIRL